MTIRVACQLTLFGKALVRSLQLGKLGKLDREGEMKDWWDCMERLRANRCKAFKTGQPIVAGSLLCLTTDGESGSCQHQQCPCEKKQDGSQETPRRMV